MFKVCLVKKIIFLIFFIYIYKPFLSAATYGSDSTVAAELSYTLITDIENRIANYGLMGSGFSFFDSSISCSFDSIFPVTGGVFFNGGRLILNKDLILNDNSCIGGGGKVFGNNYKLNFADSYSTYNFSGLPAGNIGLLNTQSLAATANSIDWSYDNSYVVAGRIAGTGNELYIYNFNGSILSLGTSVGFTAAVNCVRWHPSQNYFAFGPSAAITGNELRIYSWDGTTLTQTGGISFATGVASVSWSKDGNYLSAATTTMLYVYSFSAGVITLVTSISFSGSGTASVSALDWSTDGSYIVLGTNGVGSSLNVYSFNGSTLSLNSSISGISVRSVSWKQNENLIAVGLDGSTENLRIYEHASGLLSEKIASRIGLTATCYAARWINGSDYLVLGLATGLGYEFGTLYVSPASYKIYPVVIFSTGTTVLDAMPSNNGQYLLNAMGSSINLYRINGSDLYFYDTSLILNSDSVISQNFNMYGNCKIDARGNILDLQTGQIQVGENSNLKIKNAKISGLYSTRLKNIANSSSITLQNCEMDLYGDYTFDAGSLLIKSDVVISGTNALNYTSRFTCSIDKNSSLSINNGAKFNYAPSAARNNLIYMYDKSSVLYLNNCTFSTTTTGILLTNGTLILDNNVSLSCAGLASSESIKFGSGVVTHDLNVILDSALNLNIYGGFEYNNVS